MDTGWPRTLGQALRVVIGLAVEPLALRKPCGRARARRAGVRLPERRLNAKLLKSREHHGRESAFAVLPLGQQAREERRVRLGRLCGAGRGRARGECRERGGRNGGAFKKGSAGLQRRERLGRAHAQQRKGRCRLKRASHSKQPSASASHQAKAREDGRARSSGRGAFYKSKTKEKRKRVQEYLVEHARVNGGSEQVIRRRDRVDVARLRRPERARSSGVEGKRGRAHWGREWSAWRAIRRQERPAVSHPDLIVPPTETPTRSALDPDPLFWALPHHPWHAKASHAAALRRRPWPASAVLTMCRLNSSIGST